MAYPTPPVRDRIHTNKHGLLWFLHMILIITIIIIIIDLWLKIRHSVAQVFGAFPLKRSTTTQSIQEFNTTFSWKDDDGASSSSHCDHRCRLLRMLVAVTTRSLLSWRDDDALAVIIFIINGHKSTSTNATTSTSSTNIHHGDTSGCG